MEAQKLKDYINSKISKNKNTTPAYSIEERIRVSFDSIVSVILDSNLWIFMLDDNSRIICSYSDGENKDEYYNCVFNDEKFKSEKFFLDSQGDLSINIFVSSLHHLSIDNIDYRFVVISLDMEEIKLRNLSDRINKGFMQLINHQSKELRDYNNLLTYLDAVDDGISACDKNGIVTYINKSGYSIIGAKKEDILNKDIKSILDSDPILAKVVENKQTYMDFEYHINYKNKSFHLINSAFPVFDKNNEIIGAIDIYRRIKRSYKAAANLAGYKAIYKFKNFVGNSKALSDAIAISKKFSHSNKNILLIGESGTGKELFAQAIHNYSSRRDGPFVAINCASYPKELFDSELFGYVEGAFTGAKKGGKTGKFELADGGTLFLDEIGEMPLHLQSKLLRVIETKSLSRIGSNKTIQIDVRIISATNRNLEKMIQDKRFREDLYYRLKVLYLPLEPLRNRGEDAVLLCNHFIKKFSEDSEKKVISLDQEATELVRNYKWPGNIRELENIIALSLFYCEEKYLTKDSLIKSGLKEVDETVNHEEKTNEKLSNITNDIILNTLEKNNGNKKKTAEELGISRNTIYRLLKK